MILLDTHAWLWHASDPSELSNAARKEIASAAEIGVSIISCWEVAMLVELGRLRLNQPALEWIRDALSLPRIQLLPLTVEIAVAAVRLPRTFHSDPADRILEATKQAYRCKLITKDKQLQKWDVKNTIW